MADYSKCVIYKIQHTDDETLLYVGSTIAFRTRKSAHKNATNNPTNRYYHLKLYKMIRENGCWDAFNMIIIKGFPCNTRQEALTEEDRIMREMKANMNTIKAFSSREEKIEHMKKYNEANKDKYKAWREANKDKIKDDNKAYYQVNKDKNKDKIKDTAKAYYQVNKDKLKEQQCARYQANKDKIKDDKKIYRDANKDKYKAYYEVNKDRLKEYQRARRQANKLKINMTTQ